MRLVAGTQVSRSIVEVGGAALPSTAGDALVVCAQAYGSTGPDQFRHASWTFSCDGIPLWLLPELVTGPWDGWTVSWRRMPGGFPVARPIRTDESLTNSYVFRGTAVYDSAGQFREKAYEAFAAANYGRDLPLEGKAAALGNLADRAAYGLEPAGAEVVCLVTGHLGGVIRMVDRYGRSTCPLTRAVVVQIAKIVAESAPAMLRVAFSPGLGGGDQVSLYESIK